jgi:hypothetical protein
MNKLCKRSRLVAKSGVGVVLAPEQAACLDALARDMGVERGQVVGCAVWLLSKIGRSGQEVAVYTEWRDDK